MTGATAGTAAGQGRVKNGAVRVDVASRPWRAAGAARRHGRTWIALPVPPVVLLWGLLAIAVITGVGRWCRASDARRLATTGDQQPPASVPAPRHPSR